MNQLTPDKPNSKHGKTAQPGEGESIPLPPTCGRPTRPTPIFQIRLGKLDHQDLFLDGNLVTRLPHPKDKQKSNRKSLRTTSVAGGELVFELGMDGVAISRLSHKAATGLAGAFPTQTCESFTYYD